MPLIVMLPPKNRRTNTRPYRFNGCPIIPYPEFLSSAPAFNWTTGKASFSLQSSFSPGVRARAHSPKAEKLVNRRLDMIDMGQPGQPGYLLDDHDKRGCLALGLIIDRDF